MAAAPRASAASSSSTQNGSESCSPLDSSSDKSLHGAMAGTGNSWQEAIWGLMAGAVFGLVSPIFGHPLDTIKSKMQVQHTEATFLQTARLTYATQGILGFYRGFLPPLMGSMMYRSIQFSAYSGAYAACEHVPVLHEPIPYSGGLRYSVLVGAMAASVARATIESPLDFIKLRNQVGKGALHDAVGGGQRDKNGRAMVRHFLKHPIQHIQHLYHGYFPTLLRTMGLLGSFFVMVDYSVRYIPEVVTAPLIGPFFKGGVCATIAWVFAFPFETAKSVIQNDTTGHYKNLPNATWHVLKDLYRERGVRGWFRGFGPGAGRSFVANGASMIVYSWFQDALRTQQ